MTRSPGGLGDFLVVWISSGEQEADRSRRAIDRQMGVSVSVVSIEGLGELEAHQKMFSLFSEAAEGTICAQIDADMVLEDEWLLRDVGEFFGEHRDLDYLQVACRDGLSGSPMIGVKFFRAGADIDFSRTSTLRPDRVTVDPSRRRVVLEWVDRIAHCLDPHDEQAVHFGAHRMMKVLKKKEPDSWNAFYLRRTALRAESGHRPSRLAVLGASAVINRHRDFQPTDLDYTSLDWRNLFLGIQQRELEDDGFFEDAVNAVGSVLGELERSSEATRGVRWVLILPHLQLYGGVYRLLYLARELTRQGDEVTIVVVDLQSQDPTLLDAIRAWDLTVTSLESVRDDHWDVLVVGDVNGDTIAKSLQLDSAFTLLLAIAGGPNYRRKYREALIALRPSLSVSCSQSISSDLSFPTLLIPGGVDTEVFAPQELGPVGSSWDVVTHYGRGKTFKGFSTALELSGLLRAQGVPVHLHVISAVEPREDLPDWVTFHVSLSPEQVAEVMRRSPLAFCFEGRSGWSNFSIQALSSGCTVWGNGVGAEDFAPFFPRYALVDPSEPLGEVAARIAEESRRGSRGMSTSEDVKESHRFSWPEWSRQVRESVLEMRELVDVGNQHRKESW